MPCQEIIIFHGSRSMNQFIAANKGTWAVYVFFERITLTHVSGNPAFQRLELLTGEQALKMLAYTNVIVFGIGGVGSWCAEALIRSGIGKLTIVDSDVICVTNINRQIQATMDSIGKPKTSELGKRLRSIHNRKPKSLKSKPFQ